MSTGQWIGAILGVIVGILTFGIFGWTGIVYGAIIGYTIGGYIDPVKPDVKQPGAPAQHGLQVMTNVIGNPIFDVLGTAKITGQLLFFGKEFNQAIWYRPAKGVRAISGYKYYASWALGVCMGEVDCLYTVFRDQDPVWTGELMRPVSGGEATIQIEGMGTMVFYFGTADQMPNSNAGTLLPDPTLNTGHRHLCWAFFDACFMNEYNRMPSMSFIVRKNPPLFSQAMSRIAIFDVNPAHAIWHALVNKAGLPEEWVHSSDFLAVATTLYGEGRGISILFDVHQPVLGYLEAINNHVDNILRYGSDGKFHPKLIRYDYVPGDLPVVNESILLEEPTFSRRSWIDTINEVKVQYSEILGERITPWLEILYDNFHIYDMHIASPYIYICGLGYDGPTARPKVGKVDLASGQLLDSFMDATQAGAYHAVSADTDGVYLTGVTNVSGVNRALIHMRNKDSLSTQVWSFMPTANPSQGRAIFPEGGFVYGCCGQNADEEARVYKLNKSDGTEVWQTTIQPCARDMYLPAGSVLYLVKEHGGWNVIATVDKTTGVETFVRFNVGWPFGGSGADGSIWVGGFNSAQTRKTIDKYTLAPVALAWEWSESVVLQTSVQAVLADNDGVYGMGQDGGSPTTPFFLKLNTAGTSKAWEIKDVSDSAQRCFRAFCQLGEMLLVGTWYVGGNNAHKGRISKRNKSDGAIITL